MTEQLKKYYFTFGIDSNEQPYKGGWVTVIAQNIGEAVKKFTGKFGVTKAGCIPCAFIYLESEFGKTLQKGNYGIFEHEFIK